MLTAFQEALEIYKTLEPENIALRSGAKYHAQDKVFTITYLGREYVVDIEGKVRIAEEQGYEVPYNDRTLILQYLCFASGLPPRGTWMSFLELPDGIHHYAPFQNDATIPLARAFGSDIKDFMEVGKSLGGWPVSMADAAFAIAALPKLPLAVILWEGDEEFHSKSNILFDAVAHTHLTTASLWVLGVELAQKMLSYQNKEFAEKSAVTWLGGKLE